MATGRKTVVVGQVIDPVACGNPLWDQSVQAFASDADRTTQFPTAQRKLGAVTWLDDVKRLEVWDGALWRPYGVEFRTPTFGAGIVPFSPDFANQLVRQGKVVWFTGAVTFPAGVATGAPVWTFPADWSPAAGQGVQLSGWLGAGGAARFQVVPALGNITFQASPGNATGAGTYGFAQGMWVVP
jgi:hypothetical protein